MARYIPDEVLETIRLRADITEVVQSYVPTLKKAGAAWKACCPFHQEKTPSFTVNPSRGIYKCFGCGKGGNVFSFVMEMEKLDFPNAAEFLARKYNVIIPEEPGRNRRGGPNSAHPEADYNIRERLYQLHEKLASWYADNLYSGANAAVASYFATRKIPRETAAQFQIGASCDSWDAGIQVLRKAGFSETELLQSGVVSRKEENANHFYDRFRNRLMFPIWNEQGRVVAFSARSIEADPQGWKYVNSPESPVFKKSRTLYALHFARKGIADMKYAVLCEGQLDVIAMHRAGCVNAVAPQGTAFGEEQATILTRYTTCVCLALDNDKAGRAAVFKDALILLPKGFQLKVAVFPGAKDADELLKSCGPDAVRSAVTNAADFFEFALNTVAEETDMSTPGGKAAAAGRIAEFLHLIDNPMTLDLYAVWLADRLAISKESILAEVERHRMKEAEKAERSARYAAMAHPPEAPEPDSPPPLPAAPVKAPPYSLRHKGVCSAYMELLDLILNSQDFASRAQQDFTSEMFDSTPAGRALELVVQCAMNGEWDDAPSQIMMYLTKNNIQAPELATLLAGRNDEAPTPPKQFLERVYRGCYSVILRASLQESRRRKIEEASHFPDGSEEKRRLFLEVTELTRRIFAIKT